MTCTGEERGWQVSQFLRLSLIQPLFAALRDPFSQLQESIMIKRDLTHEHMVVSYLTEYWVYVLKIFCDVSEQEMRSRRARSLIMFARGKSGLQLISRHLKVRSRHIYQ